MKIISQHNNADFEKFALETFRKQSEQVSVYRDFIKNLGIRVEDISKIEDIPFLPVEFFKTHRISGVDTFEGIVFQSSGTGNPVTSRHYIARPELYIESFTEGFRYFYGDPSDYYILALLPSYLERESSSLVYMVDQLIKKSGHDENGFYLYNYRDLHEKLISLKNGTKKILLIGVTFALLDLAEQYPCDVPEIIIMETGGMKGRRKEITREELHGKLCGAFGVPSIHSEYGMTELLSQAYSSGNGIFYCPPWMKILVRDIHDPLGSLEYERTGRIEIIDLANQDSCSFISTSDLGKLHKDGGFEVLGRFDSSDTRGCNLMVP